MLTEREIPLVRGGKLTPEMLRFIVEVARYFPGTEKDIVIIIRRPKGEK
jgi:hypothetical protein